MSYLSKSRSRVTLCSQSVSNTDLQDISKVFLGITIGVVLLAVVYELVWEISESHGGDRGYLLSLNDLFAPTQLEGDHLVIDVGPATFRSRRQIIALASQGSSACQNVKSLDIRSTTPEPLGPTGRLLRSFLNVTDKVPRAIECLQNVRNVSWSMDSESVWLTDSIMQNLASFPPLSEFSINLAGDTIAFPPLHLLRNLTKLSVRGPCLEGVVPSIAQAIANSPDLKHLDVSYGHWYEEHVPHLKDLFLSIPADTPPYKLQHLSVSGILLSADAITSPHLRSLTSLEWMNPKINRTVGYDMIGEVWQALKSEGIRLSRLKTMLMDDDLLEFLSSYEGLKDLQLEWVTGRDDNDSDRLAKMFFQDVLPHHAESLEVLRIFAAYNGDWCLGKHNMASVLNCSYLQELDATVYWPEGLGKSEGTPVYQVLNVTSQLPHLRSLEFLASDDPLNRDAECGTNSVMYKQMVREAIVEAVERFEARVGDDQNARLPVSKVRVGWVTFRLQDGKYHRSR